MGINDEVLNLSLSFLCIRRAGYLKPRALGHGLFGLCLNLTLLTRDGYFKRHRFSYAQCILLSLSALNTDGQRTLLWFLIQFIRASGQSLVFGSASCTYGRRARGAMDGWRVLNAGLWCAIVRCYKLDLSPDYLREFSRSTLGIQSVTISL